MTEVEFRPFPNCGKNIGPLTSTQSGDLATPSGMSLCTDYRVNGKVPDDGIGYINPDDTEIAFDCKAIKVDGKLVCGRSRCDFIIGTTN